MENIKRKDGTYLTDEEMADLVREVEESRKEMGDYLSFSELDDLLIPVLTGAVQIENVRIKDTELICDLKTGDCTFETNAVYPLSKELDNITKEKVLSSRFMAFLEWQVLKNIDKILQEQ